MAPLDEGDYSPVDEENSANGNTDCASSNKSNSFNSFTSSSKMPEEGKEKEVAVKSFSAGLIRSTTNNALAQKISSNSISGTSGSGSISSTASSSSTSPQDSHNDSGYSTRIGFSAGPSPSLSGKCHWRLCQKSKNCKL